MLSRVPLAPAQVPLEELLEDMSALQLEAGAE